MCHADAQGPTETVSASPVFVPLPDERMPGRLAGPGGDGTNRVLLIHDVFGPTPFYQDLAVRLEKAGFLTLLPDLFFRQGPLPEVSLDHAYQRLLSADDRLLLRDIHASADHLRQLDHPVDRIGIIGFCWGGTQSLVLAAERQDVATVCYYGMPADPKFMSEPESPRPLDLIGSISGSVLGLWGDQDERAGMDNVRRFLDAAKTNGLDVEGHIFPGVGHGFMSRTCAPEDPASKTRKKAWDETIEFLTEQLRRT